ncbi:hypothetical protein BpHYR1_053922 [Brachionus plicatilis]|uniref:Uncharacterized protein n=1 Tax=Brachionus plicatilis TaxID=10195 RepID=A0A3M7QD00_BRAPC|nr:hypothetical protein BpHYR1_053922 [Brachionus plicatilis]
MGKFNFTDLVFQSRIFIIYEDFFREKKQHFCRHYNLDSEILDTSNIETKKDNTNLKIEILYK